jgi:diguanylate cyclase (GGDEF)-like protein/PAS domain S-box-containing protein
LLLVVVLAIPAFFYMVISAEQLRESRESQVRDDARRLTRMLASYQSSLIQSTGDLLAALSHEPVIRNQQWALCNEFLRGVLAVNPRYANLGVVAPDGSIVCSGFLQPGAVSVADRSYFRRALRASGYVVGDFHLGRVTGQRSLGVAYPMRNDDGAVRHVLYAALKVEALAPPLDEVPFHDHSVVKVFDSEGTLLASIPRDDDRIGQPVEPPALFEAARAEAEGMLDLVIDGEPWIYNFASVATNGDERGISVALSAPISELLYESERRYWRELMVAVLMLAGVMGIGWLLANTFVLRQLQALVSAAKRIAGGDLDARAALPFSSGELAELADNFDRMAERVQQQIEQLQNLGVVQAERNQLLAMIVQGEPLEQVLLRLVQLVELQIPGVVCSVLRVDDEQCIHHLVAPHLPRAYIDAIDGEKIGPNCGSCGTAAYTREAVITVDIGTDPRWDDFRELAFAHNLHACWSHPIMASGGRLLGTFAMYFHEPRAPKQDELALLDVAHDMAAIAIEASDLRLSTEQAAAQYRYLFEHNPNPMWVFDTETLRFLTVNDAAISHYGFSRDEFLHMTLRDVLPLQDLDNFEQKVLPRIREPGTTRYSQQRHRRKSGDLLLTDITSFPIEFAGRPARLSVIRDVTDVERAQRSLAERDRQLELLLESTSEGIYGIDNLGRIVFANRACAELLGYDSPDELIGLPAHQTLHHSPQELSECDGSDCPIHFAMSIGQRNHADDQCFWHREGFPVPVEYWYYPMQRDGVPDGAIISFFDITHRQAQREALAWQATHDVLTGLPNRAMLQTALQQAMVAADASSRGFALLLIDLDQFKEINDTLGHHAGDQLLRTLGPRLSAQLEADETVVRLGGDEFAMVLRSERDQIDAKVGRLLRAIEEPVDIEGTRVQVGASVGAAFYPDDGRSAEELLRCADVAMYRAKQERLRFAVYESLFDDNRPERLSLISDLRAAIGAQQLALHYQPKVDLAGDVVVGFEALMRWHHPQHGIISPGQFVQWIERSDLIHPFTAWVLEAAIRQCRQWLDEGLAVNVSVNISTGNLLDTALPDRIAGLLQQHRLPASQLELEITESSIMANPPRSLEVVGALRRLGLRVSIDDFGTGYSSLSYLQRLPVNCVKIDGSFVQGLLSDDGARLIVSAIVELSHKLGLEVVAEGVEDGATLTALRHFGCDQVQGYHIARPMPAPQALAWLREWVGSDALN